MTYIGASMSSKPVRSDTNPQSVLTIDVATFSRLFYPILSILTGDHDMHESSREFEIRPDPTFDCKVSCP